MKEIHYEENSFGENVKMGPIIPDFLPKPWELAEMTRKRKVTIMLNDESIEFFKRQAKKYKVPYQAMIRNLFQQYAI